jgi:hypothetical protein
MGMERRRGWEWDGSDRSGMEGTARFYPGPHIAKSRVRRETITHVKAVGSCLFISRITNASSEADSPIAISFSGIDS